GHDEAAVGKPVDEGGPIEMFVVGARRAVRADGLDFVLAVIRELVNEHRRRADWWKAEEARTPEEQTEDSPLLPDHMCANEAERHEWRADVLGFIRDHIEPAEAYRLGEADLAFGELLPEKPEWMEQEETARYLSGATGQMCCRAR